MADVNDARFYGGTVMPVILKMIDRVPEELLIWDASVDIRFTLALGASDAVARSGVTRLNSTGHNILLGHTAQEHCLVAMRKRLAACLDQAPSQSTKGLTFISDTVARKTLLVDLG